MVLNVFALVFQTNNCMPCNILHFVVGRLYVIRFEYKDSNKDYIKSFESEKDLNEFWETYSTDLNLNKSKYDENLKA